MIEPWVPFDVQNEVLSYMRQCKFTSFIYNYVES